MGFLGKEVLKKLLSDDKTRKIHCIAVRRKFEQLPMLFCNSRVSVTLIILEVRDLDYPNLQQTKSAVK